MDTREQFVRRDCQLLSAVGGRLGFPVCLLESCADCIHEQLGLLHHQRMKHQWFLADMEYRQVPELQRSNIVRSDVLSLAQFVESSLDVVARHRPSRAL